MSIIWTKQAYGFHQATYPLKNYNLAAALVQEVDEEDPLELPPLFLGSVTVEENPSGGLNFLFGSQLAFWSAVEKKLLSVELSQKEREKILAQLEAKIPRP